MRRRPLCLGVVAAAAGAAVVVAACAGSGASATQPPPSAASIREAIAFEKDALHHLDTDPAATKSEITRSADALRQARAAGGLSHQADADLRQALTKDENATTLVGTPNNGLVRNQLNGAIILKEAALKTLGVTEKGNALPAGVKAAPLPKLPAAPQPPKKKGAKPKSENRTARRLAIAKLVYDAESDENHADYHFDEPNEWHLAFGAMRASRQKMLAALQLAAGDPRFLYVAQQIYYALEHDSSAYDIWTGAEEGCVDCQLDDAYDHKENVLDALLPETLLLSLAGGPDEFARPSPWAPTHNVWFSLGLAGRIGEADPLTGAVKTFTIPTPNAGPEGMSVGPDGAYWFVEVLAGKVGRITPAGTITEFPLRDSKSEPEQIAMGSDGNLWFTEIDGNAIGRITPAGAITEFPLPHPNSFPLSIVGTPDGHLWFTEGAGRIGRMTITGVVDLELDLPGSDTFPTSIVYGPGRRLWFTELHADAIGSVRLDGSGLQTWTIPSPNSFPLTITPAADGKSLWFAERSTNKLGRITLAGKITERLIPSSRPLDLVGVTAGPGGRIWFSGFRSGALGSIAP